MKHIAWMLLVLVALVALPLESRAGALLVDPDPVAVPAGLSAETISKDIKRALIGRGWVVAKEEAGRIDATLNLRSHVARVAIAYDSDKVSLSYVSSENLDYSEKKGKRTIHKNYLSWVGNVMTDISKNLQLSAL